MFRNVRVFVPLAGEIFTSKKVNPIYLSVERASLIIDLTQNAPHRKSDFTSRKTREVLLNLSASQKSPKHPLQPGLLQDSARARAAVYGQRKGH